MAIEVHDLSKTYFIHRRDPGLRGALKSLFAREHTSIEAVRGISFDISQGEFVGFIGPNGAGKTTTLKMLAGILYPTAGMARVMGHDPARREHDFLSQISLVMGQKNQLTWELPAMEYFRLVKEMYRIPDDIFRRRLDRMAGPLNVLHLLGIQVRSLSLGERMKCELIAALLHRPKVVFLDEPTIGLDVPSQRAIREFLQEINCAEGTTILLTSHNMADIQKLCDRVIMIHQGVLIADDKVPDLLDSLLPYKWITVKLPAYAGAANIEECKAVLRQFGEVEEMDLGHMRLKLQKSVARDACQAALSLEIVEDLTVEEPGLEEIVEQVWNGQQPADGLRSAAEAVRGDG